MRPVRAARQSMDMRDAKRLAVDSMDEATRQSRRFSERLRTNSGTRRKNAALKRCPCGHLAVEHMLYARDIHSQKEYVLT